MKTIAEIEAERAALDEQLVEAQRPAIEAINTALAKPTVLAALAVLKDNLAGLTGENALQASYLITTLTNVPAHFAKQLVPAEAPAAD